MSIKSIQDKTPVALKPYGQSKRNKVRATQEHDRLLWRQNIECLVRVGVVGTPSEGVCRGVGDWLTG